MPDIHGIPSLSVVLADHVFCSAIVQDLLTSFFPFFWIVEVSGVWIMMGRPVVRLALDVVSKPLTEAG